MLEPILVFHTVSILDSIHDQGWYYVTVPVEWTSHQHYISPIPLNKPHPMKVEINICPSTNDKIKIDFFRNNFNTQNSGDENVRFYADATCAFKSDNDKKKAINNQERNNKIMRYKSDLREGQILVSPESDCPASLRTQFTTKAQHRKK